jgi:hypothetical protein
MSHFFLKVAVAHHIISLYRFWVARRIVFFRQIAIASHVSLTGTSTARADGRPLQTQFPPLLQRRSDLLPVRGYSSGWRHFPKLFMAFVFGQLGQIPVVPSPLADTIYQTPFVLLRLHFRYDCAYYVAMPGK